MESVCGVVKRHRESKSVVSYRLVSGMRPYSEDNSSSFWQSLLRLRC